MKVIIASTFLPSVKGGGTQIVEWLADEIELRGHDVEILWLPFDYNTEHLIRQVAALRMIDLSDVCDIVIAIRWPAFLIKHPRKRTWFIHHHRAFFDIWPTMDSDWRNGNLGMKDFLQKLDDMSLAECEAIFTNSKIVSDRLLEFNSVKSVVLYPPLPGSTTQEKLPASKAREDYVLYVSRVGNYKRQELAIRAMLHTDSNVKLIIAGKCDVETDEIFYNKLVSELGLTDKVELKLSWISEEEKYDLISRALGLIYIPIDEDSYGYPTLEAFHMMKPVITCQDSGGVHEIVQHEVNGLICEPNAESIAAAMDLLYKDQEKAEFLGTNGRQSITELNINWDHVVGSLLGNL